MKTIIAYTFRGIAFGLAFPIISICFLIFNQGYSGLELGLMHYEHPLLYIIDLAPFVLGFMAFIIGKKKHLNIQQELINTENTIKLRTQALEFKNKALQKEIKEREKVERKLKKATKEAIHAQKVEQRFLANMSHEIRTPLNSIIGFSKILSNSNLDPEPMKYLETINFASNHLLSVVNDVLDMSKINSGEISFENKTTDLKKLVKTTIQSVQITAESESLDIHYKFFTSKDLMVQTDPVRLNQVLFNLLNNAVKFTKQGNITLAVKDISDSINSDKLRIRFEVKDTGVGIAKENIHKIFNDFAQAESSTTREYGGTGLGLSISKKIVEMQNGIIGVDSEQGKGSNFWFEIEYNKGESVNPMTEDTNTPLKFQLDKEVKLLIAEDNEMNRFLIQTIFENWNKNVEITFAHNGLEAFEKVKENDFDLILMDLQMPVKDGFESTKMIRTLDENKKNIPIIALTADVLEGVKNKALQIGMTDFLTKPIQPNLLFSKVTNCLKHELN